MNNVREGLSVEPLIAVSPEARRRLELAYRAYDSRLFHAALKITRNVDDAWDAVQEGMVNALRYATAFRGDAAVASWLYRIVVNAALCQRRRGATRQRGVENFLVRGLSDAERGLPPQGGFDALALAHLELLEVIERTRALPQARRDVIDRVLRGDSYAEIAAARHESLSAVKSRLGRTVHSLRASVTHTL